MFVEGSVSLQGKRRRYFLPSASKVYIAWLAFGPCSALATEPSESAAHERRSQIERIELRIGEQKVFSAREVRSYSEGVRGIVDVRLTKDGKHFVLVGQEEGETTVLFLATDGTERHLHVSVAAKEQRPEVEQGLSVDSTDNIRLDFFFVQLDRNFQQRVGVGYPSQLSAGRASLGFDFLTQRFQSATAVVEDQALLRLDIAQTTGWAKLMRQAAVITENGKQATFSGGGEVNIPIQGSLATGIHRIEFGSTIQVLPRYDRASGRIQIELSAEVSDLTDDRGSGAPGRVTSSLQTVVNLQLGQTVVLAGLTSASESQNKAGLPLLSEIPVFGLLFGSQSAMRQAADNVVFIFPTVIDSASRESRGYVDRALEAYKSYAGDAAARGAVRGLVHMGKSE